MSATPEFLKLRIIMSFHGEARNKQTVTSIACSLREDKQRISRTMIGMEKEGLLDRTDLRAPRLTEVGQEMCEKYTERFKLALNHLLYEGVDLEAAKQDALVWTLGCSDEFIDAIRRSDGAYRVKRELRGIKRFTGETLAEKIGDGRYQFPFIIYRDHVKDGNNISMANDGFEHPCQLQVKNGTGTIHLLAKPMTQPSRLDSRSVRGKVDRVQYFEFGSFVTSEFSDDIVTIPVSVLKFVNIESGRQNIFHGSVCLRMRCSCGSTEMPESTAIFTMLI